MRRKQIEEKIFSDKINLHNQTFVDRHFDKKILRLMMFLTIVLSISGLTGCGVISSVTQSLTNGTTTTPPTSGDVILRLSGSNTIGAEFAPALVEAFLKSKGATNIKRVPGKADEMSIEAVLPGDSGTKRIEIKAHGSDTAVAALAKNECDIGMLSRKMKSDEVAQLSSLGDMEASGSENTIAMDGIAVIVNKSNPIQKLGLTQIAKIFTGEVSDWKDVATDKEAGKPGKINIYARDDKSGTYDTFKNLVLGKDKKLVDGAKRIEDSRELSDSVSSDPNGIGFVGLPYINNTTEVAVYDEGVEPLKPTKKSIQSRAYLLNRQLYFYLPQKSDNKLAREFISFTIKEEGQDVAQKVGFISQNLDPADAKDTHKTDTTALANLPKELADIQSATTPVPTILYFKKGDTNLDNKSLDDLNRVIKFLKKQDVKEVTLVGFADSDGGVEDNRVRSLKRADGVKDKFEGYDFKVTTKGLGVLAPVRPNTTEENKQFNRRVEIYYK